MDPATIGSIALSLVNAIAQNAPAIIADVTASKPYVDAIVGMASGSNATIDQVKALLAAADVSADDFLMPLPPDDGTTTT